MLNLLKMFRCTFAVIRGDVNSIQIGKNSNVQDHCMLHVSHKMMQNLMVHLLLLVKM